MGRVPKWLGDTIEGVYKKKSVLEARVVSVDYLDVNLKRVRLEGDFCKVKLATGNSVKIQINETECRQYAIAAFEPETGCCEIIFYLHGKGTGSEWATKLGVGDIVKLIGPCSELKYVSNKENYFLFGDETSLGWMKGMEKVIEGNNQFFFGFVELEEKHYDWPSLMESSVKVVPKSGDNPATPTVAILQEWEDDFWETSEGIVFYLTGSTKSITAFHSFLLSKGIKSKQIKTEAYW